MRCAICDANDQGLSLYKSDNVFTTNFHVAPNGDYICGECMSYIEDVETDYYIQDTLDEEDE